VLLRKEPSELRVLGLGERGVRSREERGELDQITPIRDNRVNRQMSFALEMDHERLDEECVGGREVLLGRHAVLSVG
jgi:hypothetical protein